MNPKSEMVQKVIDQARQNLKVHDQLVPVFFVGNDEKMVVVGSQFDGTEASKNSTSEAVKSIAQEMSASFILFVSESWTLMDQESAKDFIANQHKYSSVSEHPKAVEIVVFQIETHEAAHVGMARILEGREMGNIEWKTFPKESYQGRFTNLLKTPRRNLQ